MKGKYYANIFVHFEPSGHCIRHANRFEGKDVVIDDAKVLYERAQAKLKSKLEDSRRKERTMHNGRTSSKDGDDIDETYTAKTTPAHIKPGSLEEMRWNQKLSYRMDLVSYIFLFPPR